MTDERRREAMILLAHDMATELEALLPLLLARGLVHTEQHIRHTLLNRYDEIMGREDG